MEDKIIELITKNGENILVHTKDIENVSEFYGTRYSDAKTYITFYNGNTMISNSSYDKIKTIMLQ